MEGRLPMRAKGHSLYSGWTIFAVLIVLSAIAAAGLWGTRMALLENAGAMGYALTKSYAADEEKNIENYETVVRMGMAHLREMDAEELSDEEAEQRILYFFENALEKAGGDTIAAYAIYKGKIVATIPFEGMEDYNYQETEWYQRALEAEGQVSFTNAYLNRATGDRVVSVSAVDSDTGNTVIIDLFPRNFEESHSGLELMEGGAYYLCDEKGQILFYRAPFEVDEEGIQDYAMDICNQIQSGEMEASGNRMRDMNNKARGVYYYQSDNGWLCILTLPHSTLLQGMYGIVLWYGFILLLFLGATGILLIKDKKLKKSMENTSKTIRALGNSYYALYRLDLKEGSYEMIKGSADLHTTIPKEGEYKILLNALMEFLDKDTGEDFAKSFSMENIRNLSGERATDYGGDFLRKINGQYRWINVRLLLNESLSQGEAVLCFRQVEEEKQRQLSHTRLLEDALEAADASEKSQMKFFANMSHDMRTPLNVIIGMAELAKNPDCTREKVRDYLEKISNSSKQLLNLINDILEMSRLEKGHVSLEEKTFDLCESVKICTLPFKEKAEIEGKNFYLEVEAVNSMVQGDPFRLTQILNNLLSNALKFTSPGDSITLKMREDGGGNSNYIFIVEDTGAGMSEGFLPKLFEPYERETRFGARNVTGTGLGMSIVKSLVSQMGGLITVESVLGKGSRFVLSIPFMPGKEIEPETNRPVTEGTLKGKRILVAEDNALNMEIVTEILEEQGVEVIQAYDGRQALELFKESELFSFDAVLMDMQMPEMDGCQSTRAIRRLLREDAGKIPIIALTANVFAEDIARTAQAGMNAHLAKPIDVEMLCSTLKELTAPLKNKKDKD